MKPAKAQGEACSCVVHILNPGPCSFASAKKIDTNQNQFKNHQHRDHNDNKKMASCSNAQTKCLKCHKSLLDLRWAQVHDASPGCCPSACGCPPPETCEAASEGATLGATNGEVTLHVVAPEAQRHLPWLLVDPGPWTLLDLGPSTFLDLGPWALDQIPVR